MHTHIIINHDVGLHLVIVSTEDDIPASSIIDEMIVTQLKNAATGIQEA